MWRKISAHIQHHAFGGAGARRLFPTSQLVPRLSQGLPDARVWDQNPGQNQDQNRLLEFNSRCIFL
jgi:hypothetical protein